MTRRFAQKFPGRGYTVHTAVLEHDAREKAAICRGNRIGNIILMNTKAFLPFYIRIKMYNHSIRQPLRAMRSNHCSETNMLSMQMAMQMA